MNPEFQGQRSANASNSPAFSVVIPTYNSAATLGRAIGSVIEQSHPATEIIVVDDGSTDDSHAIVQRFGQRVHYVYQSNAGVSVARNHGAQVARSEWLAFLDADDCFYPRRLAAHAEWIARDPSVDFLLGDQDFKTFEGKLLYSLLESCAGQNDLLRQGPDRAETDLSVEHFEMLIADGLCEIRALSMRRKDFLALGGFARERKIGEDLHLFIRLCACSTRAGLVHESLAAYYIHDASVMRKDVLTAQIRYVETLESLAAELRTAPKPVRKGYLERLRRARLSLAYAHLRAGQKIPALLSVYPSLWTPYPLRGLRDLVSIARGFPDRKAA